MRSSSWPIRAGKVGHDPHQSAVASPGVALLFLMEMLTLHSHPRGGTRQVHPRPKRRVGQTHGVIARRRGFYGGA
jgi:hypothetical protein